MFKRVETDWELTMFNHIWITVWKEKNYELEFNEQVIDRYVAISPEGSYVGTSEITPYVPATSSLEAIAPMRSHPKIAADPSKVGVIDKLAIMKEHRGQPLSDLLSAIVHCAEVHQLQYFVSLLEPVLFRALRISFHLPIEKLGAKAFYKGDYVIPVLFDMSQVYANKEKYHWLVLSNDDQLPNQNQIRMTHTGT